MPLSTPSLRRIAFIVVLTLASGVVWLAFWQVAQAIFGFTQLADGITLLYIPAGIRLVILLIAGLWGAVGIALAFPLALLQVYPDVTWQEALAYASIAAIVPYATVIAVCRAANVSRDLGSLRSIHLPLLAAAVSFTGALSYTTALTAFGRLDAGLFVPNLTAMTAGDFLGCFAVVLLVRVIVAGRKSR